MFEKVNPSHPDKIADRIAGAIVDLAYTINENPRIAVEVLIGHGVCHIIAESSVDIEKTKVNEIVKRIAGNVEVDLVVVPQDVYLSENQNGAIRCGDNGIFKGVPLSEENQILSSFARKMYSHFPSDGKYIIEDCCKFIVCQSNASRQDINREIFNNEGIPSNYIINPLGDWTGGTDVDTGATNRKLGSDMGDAVTGGGLHGKDLSKADVSVNIYAFILAQALNQKVELYCAIGDEYVNGIPYSTIVETARDFVNKLGGFEKLAEWGLF